MKFNGDAPFMKLAIAKAQEGIEHGQSPFGACIVKDGQVIACGHNRVLETTDITAHAEIVTIREACRKLSSIELPGCIIYSTCEPCPMCFAACHWAKISKIVFGARIEDAKALSFSELAISDQTMKELGKSPIEIVGGFLSEECLSLFERWSKQTNRRVY